VLDFEDDVRLEDSVISWCGQNVVNGLMYGNGGLKCWPKEFVLNMKTHEAATSEQARVDFCWEIDYIQMNSCYCQTVINKTAEQAWRAGFREGVKMTLDRGIKVDKTDITKNHWKNTDRLYIWQMVGMDAPHGAWSILGARQGSYLTNLTDFDWVQIRDSDYLKKYFKDEVIPMIDQSSMMDCIRYFGTELVERLHFPIDIEPLSEQSSKFFKKVYRNPVRTIVGFMDKEDG
jgi:hypothetical protein